MKRLIAGLLIASMLGATPVAFADGNGRGNGHGWKGHGNGHGYSQRYRYPSRHHENNDNRNDAPMYVLGGLLLGGLITHAVRQSRSTAVAVSPAYGAPYPLASSGGRRLLRDLDGRCYEVGTDNFGNELRIELSPSACYW